MAKKENEDLNVKKKTTAEKQKDDQEPNSKKFGSKLASGYGHSSHRLEKGLAIGTATIFAGLAGFASAAFIAKNAKADQSENVDSEPAYSTESSTSPFDNSSELSEIIDSAQADSQGQSQDQEEATTKLDVLLNVSEFVENMNENISLGGIDGSACMQEIEEAKAQFEIFYGDETLGITDAEAEVVQESFANLQKSVVSQVFKQGCTQLLDGNDALYQEYTPYDANGDKIEFTTRGSSFESDSGYIVCESDDTISYSYEVGNPEDNTVQQNSCNQSTKDGSFGNAYSFTETYEAYDAVYNKDGYIESMQSGLELNLQNAENIEVTTKDDGSETYSFVTSLDGESAQYDIEYTSEGSLKAIEASYDDGSLRNYYEGMTQEKFEDSFGTVKGIVDNALKANKTNETSNTRERK